MSNHHPWVLYLYVFAKSLLHTAGNESVYPSFETTQLMKSPWIIPVRFIHYMPAATRHALVSMAIEHRMLRLSQKKTDPLMMEIRARFHHHRCLAIQALNDDVCNDATRGSDMTMASVMVFLYADVSLCQ